MFSQLYLILYQKRSNVSTKNGNFKMSYHKKWTTPFQQEMVVKKTELSEELRRDLES